ncbi:MAG: hypothetical protein QNK20_11805 [Aureibaculum sp.]|nr:hypothetical protein [Aureibaculum sp.]
MYIGYIKNRQDLGFMCLKDIESGKQITLVIKTGVIYITLTVFINSSLFISDRELIQNSYSDKQSHERLISSLSTQQLNTLKEYCNRGLNVQTGNVKDEISSIHLITRLRGGVGNLPNPADQTVEEINDTLKESLRFDKLKKNLISKSGEDSKRFTTTSFNKTVSGIVDKIAPVVEDGKIFSIIVGTQKPRKSELSISVKSSSKNILGPNPRKMSAKRSSSIFVEALAPINPRRWPAFMAGSAMGSDMPDLQEKLQTPFNNLIVAKEYLETSQSDTQWRDRLWQFTEDTMTINAASELGGYAGSFAAGATANKIADGYMEEMVITEVTKNEQEKLNLEIFKQTARDKGIDVSEVRGTGVMREFVPDFMQEDICDRPERKSRPNSWSDTSNNLYEDNSSFN